MNGIPDVNGPLGAASDETLRYMIDREDARSLHNVLYMANSDNRERILRHLPDAEADAIRSKLGGTTALDLKEVERVLRELPVGGGA